MWRRRTKRCDTEPIERRKARLIGVDHRSVVYRVEQSIERVEWQLHESFVEYRSKRSHVHTYETSRQTTQSATTIVWVSSNSSSSVEEPIKRVRRVIVVVVVIGSSFQAEHVPERQVRGIRTSRAERVEFRASDSDLRTTSRRGSRETKERVSQSLRNSRVVLIGRR